MGPDNLVTSTDFLVRRFRKFSKQDLITYIHEYSPSEEDKLLRSRRKEVLERWAVELEVGGGDGDAPTSAEGGDGG